MIRELVCGARFAAITMVVLGGAYPFAVWAVGQAVFSQQAQGSLLRRGDGGVLGSALVAQAFAGDTYFQPRPSAVDYNAASTGGTNDGPTNPDHLQTVKERVAAVRERERIHDQRVPADLVTASGAGLDPHLSPEAIAFQARRVAAARGVTKDSIMRIVDAHTERPTLGLLGRARVNVLRLNLALDASVPARATSTQ
jgi:K+-transporting ATPase ATPase C chain